MKRMLVCLVLAAVAAIFLAQALAVVITQGDGSGNTGAPADDPGWANVGRLPAVTNAPFTGSCVYVGNSWILTAYHIQANNRPTNVIFSGVSYALMAETWTRLTNSNGSGTDLTMVRVAAPLPALGSLDIRSAAIQTGNPVTLIGNGYERATTNAYWNANWGETNEANRVFAGYKLVTSRYPTRWGTNTVGAISANINDGFGTTTCFSVIFDELGGGFESVGVVGDSGGGAFVKRGGTWELAGIMIAPDRLSNHTYTTTVFGDKTWVADLAPYRSQIQSVIPEPSAFLLLVAGAGAIRMVRRNRNRRA